MSPSLLITPAHPFAFLSHLCTSSSVGHILTRTEVSSQSWMLGTFSSSRGGQRRARTSLLCSVFIVRFEALLQYVQVLPCLARVS